MGRYSRAQLHLFVNAMNLAVTATLHYVAPGIPADLELLWVGAVAAGLRWGENVYDERHPAPAVPS